AARIGLVLDAYPADELAAQVDALAYRMSLNDPGVLSVLKRGVNLSLELAGGSTMARLAAELDAPAHSAHGPRPPALMDDIAQSGLKAALTRRDAPFGDSLIRLSQRR